MKSFVYSIICTIAMVFSLELKAQTDTSCPSDEKTATLISSSPQFQRSFYHMQQMLLAAQDIPEGERTDDLYTLPVVVHVIHEGEPIGTGSNISDAQIFSAIEALNNDFRHVAGTNGDGAGADVNIEFCLASRDPNGAPTTGIVRLNGSSVPLYADQGIEASGDAGADEFAVKALSTWPRESYVNIWIVNEIENNDAGGGVQGYAYFPVNSPIDGIVVLHNAFGTVGNLKSYTNMNRTLTHEVGHFLGLYHTFNSTSSCGAETNCAIQGDQVCDTPATILNASCSSPACSGTQQVENYMDYTPQTCMDMFTAGQKLRMRTTLETQRTSMISSLGCMPVFVRDAGITAVLSPNGTSCSTSYAPVATLTNFGSQTLTSVSILYNVDGIGSNTYAWTGTLTGGTSINVTLPSITTSIGTHTLYVWTNNPNGQADENSSNNQSTSSFTVTTGSMLTLDIEKDYFSSELTWQITNSSNAIMDYGGPYADGGPGQHIYESICLPDGCYTLTFMDEYGDGQGLIYGDFTLTDSQGTILVFDSGNWGSESVNPFCVTGAPSGSAPTASFSIADNVVCIGQSASFTNTSSGSPTSYAWTFENGTPATSTQTSPTGITWTTPGQYDVTLVATNAFGSNTYVCNNCITVDGGANITLTSTQPLCNNASTGSITAALSGAYSPFVFSWSTGSTNATINNLTAGSYTITVTNQQGCPKSATQVLTNPSAITVTGTVTNVLCAGALTGSISVSATGGTGSKTFSWNTGATGSTLSNVAAGIYTVTATDANGCTKTQNFTITQPVTLTVSGNVVHSSCNGANTGSITVNGLGGTGTKTYSWSNGASGASITGLDGGNYTVTVSDQNGCTVSQTFTVNEPAVLSANLTDNDISCTMTVGSAQVSPTGGTAPYTVLWNTGATTTSVNNLVAGSYSVMVTDANGCYANGTFTITQAAGLSVTLNPTHVTCNGLSNGIITVNTSSVSGPFTYSWSNGSTASSLSNLSAGSYSVTVTTAQGCSGSALVTITQPSALALNVTAQDITCFGANNGSVQASVTGGTLPYSYDWSNGVTSSTLSNLSEGNYTVTVTDANGCSVNELSTVASPAALHLAIFKSDITCYGQADGAASATVTGGVAPYSVLWSNGNTTLNLEDLALGSYTCTVTDANGCSDSENFIIVEPSLLVANTVITSEESCAGNDGGAIVNVMGGGGVYTIEWSNGSFGQEVNELTAGDYTVAVTDNIGCALNINLTIPYECTQEVAQTQLIETDCGITGLTNASIITCETVSNASMYQWKFMTAAGQIVDESYTLSNQFALLQLSSLVQGETYNVAIRAMVESAWGAYGTVCSITMEEADPTTGIEEGYCGSTLETWGSSVYAIVVEDAVSYEWEFTGFNFEWTSYTATNQFIFQPTQQFIPGETYSMRVRAALGAGEFTPWSEACEITIDEALEVPSIEPLTGSIVVYPNPSDGEYIVFDLRNLSEGTIVEDLRIFDAAGNLVELIDLRASAKSKAHLTYEFRHPLASGMYIIHYTMDGKSQDEKLIVR